MKSVPTALPAEGVCLSHLERHRQDSEPLRCTPQPSPGKVPLCWKWRSVRYSRVCNLS